MKPKLYSSKRGAGARHVVLLHGLLGASNNLNSVARVLSETYSVVSFDLRNHGRSFHHDEMSFPLMAEDVATELRAMSVSRCRLLGHSLGGKVAMATALLYPEMVQKLLVAEIAPVTYPPFHNDIFMALEQVLREEHTSRESVDASLAKSIQDSQTRQFLMQNLQRHEGLYRWRMNLAAIRDNYDVLRAGIVRPAAEEANAMVFRGEPYSGPVQFVAGQSSDYLRSDYEAQTRDIFPNMSYRQIARAGHNLHVDQPELFNRQVLRFFAD